MQAAIIMNLQLHVISRIVSKVPQILVKNGFAIFSGAVAVGSKGGLTVPGAVWAITVDVWDVAASMWDVTVSMWAVTASMWAVTSSM